MIGTCVQCRAGVTLARVDAVGATSVMNWAAPWSAENGVTNPDASPTDIAVAKLLRSEPENALAGR